MIHARYLVWHRFLTVFWVLPNNFVHSRVFAITSGATGAIAPVPIFQGGAPLQFLFLLFLVIFALILQKLELDLVNYLVRCMLCIKSCISYVNVCMVTSIVRMALALILNFMELVGIYIPARYHMIMSKIDIITITFSLKLSFFKHTCVYLNFKHIRNCMPYMFLEFFRLKSSFSYSFSRKRAGNCLWQNGYISIFCQNIL